MTESFLELLYIAISHMYIFSFQYGVVNVTLNAYLNNAMTFFRNKFEDRLFIVASDDINKTRSIIDDGSDVVFINGK